jgi:hypothetical protein
MQSMSFLIVLATCFSIGLLAQRWKGRTGATWGFITFGLIIPTWILIYVSTHAVSPVLYREEMAFPAVTFLVCLLMGGIMAVVVASLPKKPPSVQAATVTETRQCPFCAEMIKEEAKLCRYCGRDIPVHEQVTAGSPESSLTPTPIRFGWQWSEVNGEWQTAIRRGLCPRCEGSARLEVRGEALHCPNCAGIFPYPEAPTGPMCPQGKIPVRVTKPICPQGGQRVRLSRPA